MGFKLMAGAVASCALIGVAVGVGIIYGSLLISIHIKFSIGWYLCCNSRIRFVLGAVYQWNRGNRVNA